MIAFPHTSPIIAVVVIDDPEDAIPLARTLLDSGIESIELTLRTPDAIECLSRIRKECPAMQVGAGTVLTPKQVTEVTEAGAAFAVAPGFNPKVVEAAKEASLPFAPGILSPSELEGAMELGCRTVKFFPAEPSGGVAFLKSMSAPYAHCGISYIPLGGLTLDNFTDYLELDIVPAIGGSWIAPRNLIQAKDWNTIATNAKAAVQRIPKTKS